MDSILGYRDFLSSYDIRSKIKGSENYRGESIDMAEMLCFFQTRTQRTWMIITNERVYLVLDDIRKEVVKVNRSFRIKVVEEFLKVDPDYRTSYGRIFFKPNTRGWLYSKSIFSSPEELYKRILISISKMQYK